MLKWGRAHWRKLAALGLLVLSASSANAETTSKPTLSFDDLPYFQFGLAGLCMILILVVSGWQLRTYLFSEMGVANYDFSKSWTSNLTLALFGLGSLLKDNLPETPVWMPKQEYSAVSLVFAICLFVGPMVYLAIQRSYPSNPTPSFRGWVWSYIVANCITVFAVVGQLTTVAALFYAMHASYKNVAWLWGPVVMLLLLIPVDLFYSARMIVAMVRDNQSPPADPGLVKVRPMHQVAPSWTML